MCIDVAMTSHDLQTFVIPTGIRQIIFSNNNISHVSSQILHKFRELEKFDITNNLLDNITWGTFADFGNLTSLVLSRNRLRHLDGQEFSGLVNLETLDLSGNQIDTLHEKMFVRLTSIQSIKLRFNSISVVPNNVFTPLKTLQKLFVSNNQITELEDRAFQNLSMIKLDFTNNKLTKISRSTFFNFRILYKIMLLFNNLDCRCKQAMIYARHFKDMINSVYATCSTPLQLEGKPILTAYVGTQCTLCDLDLCNNGAGCQGNKTHFTCMCAEQFKGRFCERNICKPQIKFVDRYVQLPNTKVLHNETITTKEGFVAKQIEDGGGGGGIGGSTMDQLEDENKELETKLLILYAICSIELVIILCFVGLLILGKYQDWRLMKKYNMDKKSPHILEKFQWTPASEIENLNGGNKGYISIREVIPYKI